MNNQKPQLTRFIKPSRILPAVLLAILALSACDSVTQAPPANDQLQTDLGAEATPAPAPEQESAKDLKLAPTAARGDYYLPSFQGTSVQVRINSNYVDSNGIHRLDMQWWGQNRGKPNLSIVQFTTRGDTRWHVAGGDPRLQNGRITAYYGIWPYQNAGPFPFNAVIYPGRSTDYYFRICTVGNYTTMPLTCGTPFYFRF